MAISRSDWGFVSSTKMLTGLPPTSESVSSSSGDGGGRASPFWPVLSFEPSFCFLIGPFEEEERFEVCDFDPVNRRELISSDRSVPVETGSNRFGCSFGFAAFVRLIVGVPDLEEFRLDDRIGWADFGFWILVPDFRFGLVARDPIREFAFDPILDPFLG